jgi:hypothetical protein
MLTPLLWQSANPNPDNLENFQIISQWWQDLNLKEVFWQQRLIPDTGSLEDINWERQGFDEKFSHPNAPNSRVLPSIGINLLLLTKEA